MAGVALDYATESNLENNTTSPFLTCFFFLVYLEKNSSSAPSRTNRVMVRRGCQSRSSQGQAEADPAMAQKFSRQPCEPADAPKLP